jgi:hypothetical protein
MYANVLLASDGLLIVHEAEPLGYMIYHIVVPRDVCNGLLMAFHIQCYHPSAYQLKKLFNRYLFALGLDEAIVLVSKGCQQCAAVKDIPRSLIEQSTSAPP